MFGLLKDGTFTVFLVLLGIVGLIMVAGGMLLGSQLLYHIRGNLPTAFTPGFIQVTVVSLQILVALCVGMVCIAATECAKIMSSGRKIEPETTKYYIAAGTNDVLTDVQDWE